MAKGIILVETYPSSPEREQEYNTWYDEVHLQELVALDGFVSARRLRPVDGDGPYVALYEIEGDDLQAVLQGMNDNAGKLHHVRRVTARSAAGHAAARGDDRIRAERLAVT